MSDATVAASTLAGDREASGIPDSTGALSEYAAPRIEEAFDGMCVRGRIVEQPAQQASRILQVGLRQPDLRRARCPQAVHLLHLDRPHAGNHLAADFEPLLTGIAVERSASRRVSLLGLSIA
ncbi:hypothetical protein [Cupriavidus sp. L7L]|uniref:hypothetical protein n=1 Tax=Cupriavidus sp. L7L TaxID=2546443 RepID=UPI001FB64A7C|nr:hypothetical protein [Cupriavidus sp. L7L]